MAQQGVDMELGRYPGVRSTPSSPTHEMESPSNSSVGGLGKKKKLRKNRRDTEPPLALRKTPRGTAG